MRTPITGRFARTAAATLATAVLGCMAATSHAAVGAKVIVQGWEPWNDNRQPTVVPIDDQDFISGALSEFWVHARGPICDALRQGLARPDLLHRGVTLYNISCQFNAADVRLLPLSANRAKLVMLLPGSKLSATSTTPNVSQLGADVPLIGDIGLPGGTDPRFSVSVDAQLELDVEIGDAPRPFLTVHQVRFNLKRADARGENITGKLAEWVASKVIPFFGGPNFERMAEGLIDGIGGSFTSQAQHALSSVNARVAAYAQYVRVQTWMSASRIAVALQPRSLPTSQLRGEMRGVLRDLTVGRSQSVQNAQCEGFRVFAQYQAAPRPIVNPDRPDELGPARMVPVGAFSAPQRLPDGSCAYSVTGLAYGVTNYVNATHPSVGGSSGSLISNRTVLLARGWEGHSVTPRPFEANRDYALVSDLRGQAGFVQLDPRRQRIDPIIEHTRLGMSKSGAAQALNPQPLPPKMPVINEMAKSQARVGTAPSAGVAAIGSAVALNPQPLPPKADRIAPLTAATPVLRTNSAGAMAIGSATQSSAAARAAMLR